MLNFPPFKALDGNTKDFSAFSPYFSVAAPLSKLSGINVTNSNQSTIALAINSTEELWRKWSKEYLHNLQQKQKWVTSPSTIGSLEMEERKIERGAGGCVEIVNVGLLLDVQ